MTMRRRRKLATMVAWTRMRIEREGKVSREINSRNMLLPTPRRLPRTESAPPVDPALPSAATKMMTQRKRCAVASWSHAKTRLLSNSRWHETVQQESTSLQIFAALCGCFFSTVLLSARLRERSPLLSSAAPDRARPGLAATSSPSKLCAVAVTPPISEHTFFQEASCLASIPATACAISCRTIPFRLGRLTSFAKITLRNKSQQFELDSTKRAAAATC
jgi:hypothetical protein